LKLIELNDILEDLLKTITNTSSVQHHLNILVDSTINKSPNNGRCGNYENGRKNNVRYRKNI